MTPLSNNTTPSEDALFAAALDLPEAERRAYLDDACRDDEAMRARLEALLAAHDNPDSMLQGETDLETIRETPDDASVGQTLGRYKLLERVGEGGCGVVYVAEQTEPVRRRVALKVIKLGMDTKQVVARFEAERQALAMMDHPNIAKVLDAGTTEHGRPYFVMELVRGIRITDYCDQERVSTGDRLNLFIKVCQAIQHAHQKGIVHRDIKPSNILVTLHDGVPVPKVIDFGIAKATEGRLTDATVYTQLHQFVGTPAYMSPEQAEMSGLDIDTRSDIYSLGVLLYELLTSRTPFDGKALISMGIDAMRKAIREEEPPRPSTRFATLQGKDLTRTADRRSVDRAKLIHQLKGDLDWIVMKCLEKDRQRRYDTANGLAADLKRHLGNEPVVARPPSAIYRFQKAWKRNKLVYAAGTAVVIALGIGIAFSLWQATEARTAQHAAEEERGKAVAARAEAVDMAERAQREEKRAVAGEQRAREQAYAADMNLAMQAVGSNNFGRARRLLSRHWPDEDEVDLRDWEWCYLWQLCESDEVAPLSGHVGRVYDVAISPDGRLLASSSEGKGLHIQKVPEGDLLHAFTKDTWTSAMAFDPSGEVLALACHDGFIRFLNPLSGTEAAVPIRMEHPAQALVFSSSGHYLAVTTSSEVIIWIHGSEEREPWYRFPSEAHFARYGRGLAFSPDENWLAVSQQSGVSLVDLRDPEPKVTQRSPMSKGDDQAGVIWSQDVTIDVAFSSDSSQAAVVGWNGRIRLLQRNEKGDWANGDSWIAHDAWISGVSFMDHSQLVTASADQLVKIWNWRTQEELAILRGHRDEVHTLALSPDGTKIFSGASDGDVKVFPTSSPARANFIEKRVSDIDHPQFSANKEYVGLLTKSDRVLVFRTSTLELVLDQALDIDVRCFAVGNDGDQVFVGDSLGQIQAIKPTAAGPLTVIQPHEGAVDRLYLSLDGKQLASLGKDKTVRIFDLSTRSETFVQETFVQQNVETEGSVYILAFSEDGTRLSIADIEGAVGIWDIASGQQLLKTEPHSNGVWQQIFLRDDRQLAVASSSGYLTLWDLDPLQKQGKVKGQLLGLHCISVSPNERRFAVGTSEGLVKLWSSDLKHEMMTLDAGQPFETIHAIEFLPDDRSIVAVNDHSLFMWRAPLLKDIQKPDSQSSL